MRRAGLRYLSNKFMNSEPLAFLTGTQGVNGGEIGGNLGTLFEINASTD
jgi:hypothetical protein